MSENTQSKGFNPIERGVVSILHNVWFCGRQLSRYVLLSSVLLSPIVLVGAIVSGFSINSIQLVHLCLFLGGGIAGIIVGRIGRVMSWVLSIPRTEKWEEPSMNNLFDTRHAIAKLSFQLADKHLKRDLDHSVVALLSAISREDARNREAAIPDSIKTPTFTDRAGLSSWLAQTVCRTLNDSGSKRPAEIAREVGVPERMIREVVRERPDLFQYNKRGWIRPVSDTGDGNRAVIQERKQAKEEEKLVLQE